MKLVKAGHGTVYEAKKHFGVWSAKIFSPDTETRSLTVSISHYLPSGGAEMSSSDQERVYAVLGGSITVRGRGESFLLEKGDMIYIAPGEERAIAVNNNQPATIMVIMAKV